MGLSKCSVPGCQVNLLQRHQFPNPRKDLLRTEKNPALNKLDPENLYKKTVCHRHFENCYFSPGANRLHANAVPTLNLPSEQTRKFYINLLFFHLL